MKALDLQIPFFLPVWRRVLLIGVCAVWSIIEFANAAPYWSVISGALGAYAAWQLFLREWPENMDVLGDDNK